MERNAAASLTTKQQQQQISLQQIQYSRIFSFQAT